MIHVLYVIGTDWHDDLKIGVSSDPVSRLNAFNEMHPRLLELLLTRPLEDAFSVEAHVHRCLDHARLNGEWFDGTLLSEAAIEEAISTFPGRQRVRPEPDQYTKQAGEWARKLVAHARFKRGVVSGEAMKLLSEEMGVLPSLLWSLHYRPTKTVSAPDYFAVKAAFDTLPNEPAETQPTETKGE
jgi:hypothetical protein